MLDAPVNGGPQCIVNDPLFDLNWHQLARDDRAFAGNDDRAVSGYNKAARRLP